MDFSWTSTFNGFWFFPLLCLIFMALMMFACHGRSSGCRDCGRSTDRRPDTNNQAPHPGALMEDAMPAIMIVVCLVLMVGGSYGFRRDHDANRLNVETPSVQINRTTQPEQEKP